MLREGNYTNPSKYLFAVSEWKQPVILEEKKKEEKKEIKNKENTAATSECSSKESISVFLSLLGYKIQNGYWAVREIHINILSKIKHIHTFLRAHSTVPLKSVWEMLPVKNIFREL